MCRLRRHVPPRLLCLILRLLCLIPSSSSRHVSSAMSHRVSSASSRHVSSASSNPATLAMTPSNTTTTQTPYECSSQANRGWTSHNDVPRQRSTPRQCCCTMMRSDRLGHVHLPLPFSPSRHRLTTSLQHHPLAGFFPYTQNLMRGR